MKYYLSIILIFLLVSCSSITTPSIDVKNNVVLQDGFSFGVSSLRQKYILFMKSDYNLNIRQIDYDLKLPNYSKPIQGTFFSDTQVTIKSNQGYREFMLKSEEISYFDICNQLTAMFKNRNDINYLKMDITFYTTSNKKIIARDVEIKFRNASLWDQVRNYIAEKGCNIIELALKLKNIFGV